MLQGYRIRYRRLCRARGGIRPAGLLQGSSVIVGLGNVSRRDDAREIHGGVADVREGDALRRACSRDALISESERQGCLAAKFLRLIAWVENQSRRG